MKKEENAGKVISQGDLIQIMSRVGEPSLIGEENVSLYNMIAPIYSNPKCRYSDELKPGYRTRCDAINEILRNRYSFIQHNINRNIMIELFSTILDPVDIFGDGTGRLGSYEEYNLCPLTYNYDMTNIESLIGERSILLDLSTTTDYAVASTTRIYNDIIRLLGNRPVDKKVYDAITIFMGKVLDFITYQLCLYKFEAVSIYKNAISIDEAEEEKRARDHEIDVRTNLSEIVGFIISQNTKLQNGVDSISTPTQESDATSFYSGLIDSCKESAIKGSKKIRNQMRRNISRSRYDEDEYDD